MPAILLLHLVAACVAPFLARKLGRNTLLLMALAPLTAVAWALSYTREAFTNPPEFVWDWVGELGLGVVFRLDPLSWMMTLIVSGVGAIVMIYASRYFSENAVGLGRFSAIFTGFAAAMLGLVTADHLIIIYLFWELTTIFSYLLIGHHFDRRPARAAARQSIQVTGLGGLAMFAGFVMIGEAPGGTYSVTELVERVKNSSVNPDLSAVPLEVLDLNSPQVIVAALLIIIGAGSKSALVPHHFWLPGAMAAPTPVSAYLHAAAMVKAGVYLIARLTPGFTFIPGWSPVLVVFGFATMFLGAYRALRQYDLKLVLAYGTVSQLGLMTAAIAYGTAATYAAGIAMLVAHAVFKSALFMSVGLVEKATGTRDLRDISALYKYEPVLAISAAVLASSMAGIPPLLGYVGKEAFITTLIAGTNAPWGEANVDTLALVALTIGSMFTAAYSWRYWWGAFARKRLNVEMQLTELPKIAVAPVVLLALASFAAISPGWLQTLTEYITAGGIGSAHIALWSGIQPALLTALILAGGAWMAWKRPLVARIQRRIAPKHLQIHEFYRWTMLELELIASKITRLLHRGSLPWDITTIFLVFIAALGFGLVEVGQTEVKLRLWDSLVQVGIAGLAITAAFVTVKARSRINAVLALGVVGSAVSLLYMSYGAPDLALTQMLVEVVSLVVFVLVLRSLPQNFSVRTLAVSRWMRIGIATMIGIVVSGAAIVATQARVAQPISTLIPAEAYVFGAGENVVNVILVDTRAWDTVGELSVLLATATGVASMIYLVRRNQLPERKKPTKPGSWLPAIAMVSPRSRSLLLEVGTRILFPTMLIASLWLLWVGHNHPGGGFAGGILAGIAFTLRYMAGGRHELMEAAPINPGRLLGFGLFTAAVGAFLPLAFGNTVLQSTPIDISLGALGTIHFTSALLVDIGVYLLVVALVLDLITALGGQIDKDRAQDEADAQKAGAKQGRKEAK
ncbi:MAG: Na+/H+ antiporter subunit A [Actinomycetaceae bacterium]|nr:Na+/H+ antiporter subunit A [Actinomycetaceae bacterium]